VGKEGGGRGRREGEEGGEGGRRRREGEGGKEEEGTEIYFC